MLTDGISQDRVARQASLLRAKQVEIFTVGIGQALKRRQLLQIATDRNHVSVVSFRGLATLSKAIRSKICQLITPTGLYMSFSWGCFLNILRKIINGTRKIIMLIVLHHSS